MKALKDHYANAKTVRVDRLALLDHMGHVIIPRIALSFVALFWIIGLNKYNNPDLTVDMILDFIASPLIFIGSLALVIIIPLTCFCYRRCCKR